MSLYDINSDLIRMMAEIDAAEGEVSPELELALEVNSSQLESKGDAYSFYITEISGQVATIDAEIKRLQALKTVRNNHVDRLKSALLDAVNLHGNFETPLHKFSTRQSTSTVVDDIDLLPADVVEVVTTKKADKKEIKAMLAADMDCPGAHLEHKKHLVIK